jgi:acetylornithine deacetylase/succinyl-diaminopimelate desuccinylase-like protein
MVDAHALLSAAEQHHAEVVAFLQDLVRLRSVNGRDGESAVAQRVAEEAEHLGLGAELTGAEPNRSNVLVHWGDGPEGFALIGHMDTVAEGDRSAWAYPPFGGTIDDGRLYGRGAADNKAGIACGLYALAVIRDCGLLDPAAARITLAGVVDEESGASSQLGVRYLLDQGLLTARGAIYTYTSDIICVGHRGLLRLVLRATGQSIHSGSAAWSRGEGGVNAVTGLARILTRFEGLDIPVPAHPGSDSLYPRYEQRTWLDCDHGSAVGFSHPIGVFFTGMFFGFADALAIRLQTTTNVPPSLVQFLPHVFTLLAIILVAARSHAAETLARRAFRLRAQREIAAQEASNTG